MPSDDQATEYRTRSEADARLRVIAATRAAMKREDHAFAEEARRLTVLRATLPEHKVELFGNLPPVPRTKPSAIDAILERMRLAVPGATPRDAQSRAHPAAKVIAFERRQTVLALAVRVQEGKTVHGSEHASAGAVAKEVRGEWLEDFKTYRTARGSVPTQKKLADALYRISRQNPTALADALALDAEIRSATA